MLKEREENIIAVLFKIKKELDWVNDKKQEIIILTKSKVN